MLSFLASIIFGSSILILYFAWLFTLIMLGAALSNLILQYILRLRSLKLDLIILVQSVVNFVQDIVSTIQYLVQRAKKVIIQVVFE